MLEKRLLIDIDIPYAMFQKYLYSDYLKQIEICSELYNIKILSVKFEESSHRNTHVLILLEEPITDFNVYITAKMCLYEDQKRLIHDIRRYKKYDRRARKTSERRNSLKN
jgi:hypothetical protein